jgi:hypothetical protein
MVLYRILGVTLYDDDSLGSPIVVDVPTEVEEIREASALMKPWQSKSQSYVEGIGELVLGGLRSGLHLEELKLSSRQQER